MKLRLLPSLLFACGSLSPMLLADFTIPLNSRTSYYDLGSIQPGETIFIEAGERTDRMILANIAGTEEQPILITNSGGAVILNNAGRDGFMFQNCHHFIFRGQYVEGTGEYGIQVVKTGDDSGIDLRNGTTNFEIAHIEVSNTGFAGIIAKSDSLTRDDFVMEDVLIHDCYIHDTGGEGMYIGSSFYISKNAHEIHGLRIYGNRIENAGWDGLQVGCAAVDTKIYNNVLIGYGGNTDDYTQNEGFRINPGTAGEIYGNTIMHGLGTAIFANPHDDMWIYNNLIVDAAEEGIYIADDAALIAGSRVVIANNTIVNVNDGVQFRSRDSVGNLVQNNFIVNVRGQYLNRRYFGLDITETANLYLGTLEEAGFVNPAEDDFHLLSSSYALESGLPIDGFDIATDLDGNPRPHGSLPDAGAFEYAPTVSKKWGDWEIVSEDGWVNTGSFLGWVNVTHAPWIWPLALQDWIYLPEGNLGQGGAWGFMPR